MATKKISELPAATTPLAGTETAVIVQGGASKKVAVSQFGTSSAGPLATVAYNPASDTTVAKTGSTSVQAFDASNLLITFTFPTSGIVTVFLESLSSGTSAGGRAIYWALLDGASTVTDSVTYITNQTAIANAMRRRIGIRVVGTPGVTKTYLWACKLENVGDTATLFVGKTTPLGAAVMEVYAGN